MVRRAQDGNAETEAGVPVRMWRMVTAQDTQALSVTEVELRGRHPGLRTDASDRAYYVISGTGTFTLGDAGPRAIAAGDHVLVPRGTPYALAGELRYLVINAPAFHHGDDVFLGPEPGPA